MRALEKGGQQYADKFQLQKSIDESTTKRHKYAGLSRKAKRRKMAREEDEGTKHDVDAAIRQAKKLSRPGKIGLPQDGRSSSKLRRNKKAKSKTKVKNIKSVGFERDMNERNRR